MTGICSKEIHEPIIFGDVGIGTWNPNTWKEIIKDLEKNTEEGLYHDINAFKQVINKLFEQKGFTKPIFKNIK